MEKKLYARPEVTAHEAISFETGLSSCVMVATVDGTNPPQKVCLKSDHIWYPLP